MTLSPISPLVEALERNREQGSPTVQFGMRIDPLADTRHCQVVTKTLKDLGGRWEELLAEPSAATMLPDEPGLYMFVWRPELYLQFSTQTKDIQVPCMVLYVGQAGDSSKSTLRSRFKGEYVGHLQGADPNLLWESDDSETEKEKEKEKERELRRKERLRKFLALRPLYLWFMTTKYPDRLLQAEKLLIRALNPPLNWQGGLRARTRPPVAAF